MNIAITKYMVFMYGFFKFFIVAIVGLLLMETVLVTLLHAIFGHGLRLSWLFGKRSYDMNLPSSKKWANSDYEVLKNKL